MKIFDRIKGFTARLFTRLVLKHVGKFMYDNVPKGTVMVSLVSYKLCSKKYRMVRPPKSHPDYMYINAGLASFLINNTCIVTRTVYLGAFNEGSVSVDALDANKADAAITKLLRHKQKMSEAYLDNIIIPEYGTNMEGDFIVMNSIAALCKMIVELQMRLEKSPQCLLMFTYPK